jgi:adenosylhomocysteine nucleosidase
MNNKCFNVGLVIADIDEYVHITKRFADAEQNDKCGLLSHNIKLSADCGEIVLKTICSGIGKVNATAAAAIIAPECDMLLNAGLSGGFSDAGKFDIVCATGFVEHDFDLTGIGFKPAEKPGREIVIKADEFLLGELKRILPTAKFGVFATGDSFVCTEEKHNMLKDNFNPIACDMESAAVAYVAAVFGLPFASIRMISDGASDTSKDAYTDTLRGKRADGWLEYTLEFLTHMRLL